MYSVLNNTEPLQMQNHYVMLIIDISIHYTHMRVRTHTHKDYGNVSSCDSSQNPVAELPRLSRLLRTTGDPFDFI